MKSRADRDGPGLAAVVFLTGMLLSATVSVAQQASLPSSAGTVHVGGEVSKPFAIREDDLAALPHQSVSVAEGTSAKEVYQGIPVVQLLRRAGAPLGDELRGTKMRLYVLVKARDGYAAVFALSEFDPGFTDRVILLADRRQGHALGMKEGPFRLIVPEEKRHARWVRQVSDIDVVSAK